MAVVVSRPSQKLLITTMSAATMRLVVPTALSRHISTSRISVVAIVRTIPSRINGACLPWKKWRSIMPKRFGKKQGWSFHLGNANLNQESVRQR